MKYFIYVRKSTDVEDKQVLSVEAQIVELKEYASKYGLEIVDILIEKRTAKKPGRPILNKMLVAFHQAKQTAFCHGYQIDYLVIR